MAPGIRQFQWKTNFIILVVLHVVLFGSSFLSPVLTGSITWNPDKMYVANDRNFYHTDAGIPQAGYKVVLPRVDDSQPDPKWMDSVMRNFMVDYFRLWDDVNHDSTSMCRLIRSPYGKSSPPKGSKIEDLRIPYFFVDDFKWITDPSFTLTTQQILSLTRLRTDAPPEMDSHRWGLIPDVQWGKYDDVLPAPHSVIESRLFAISLLPPRPPPSYQSTCDVTWAHAIFPPDVLPVSISNATGPSCFIVANVTYRAGAAYCRQCKVYGPGKVKEYGDFKDLKLIDNPLTSVALAIAPYLGVTLGQTDYAMPSGYQFAALQNQTIELLSRSYQLAWGGIKTYGKGGSETERFVVQIAVDATVASVSFWRVAVWSSLHAMLLILGVLFRHLNMRGDHQWVEDPAFTALLVDPTPLERDMEKLAEDASDIQVARKLERDAENPEYIIITRSRRSKANPESIDSATGDKFNIAGLRGRRFFRDSSATDSSVLIPLANRKDLGEGYHNEAWDSRFSNLDVPFREDRKSSPVGHGSFLTEYDPYDGYSWVSQQPSDSTLNVQSEFGSVGLGRSASPSTVHSS